MTVCLVTNRRRLCPDGSPEQQHNCLIQQAQFAVDASIDLVQVRENDLPGCDLAALVRAMLMISRGRATRIIVNDRLDIALACGADGVHLRGDSIPAAQVRELAPPSFLVGRSIHSIEEARSAGPVDYLVAGTVFPSESKADKRDHELLGIAGLASIVRMTRTPVLAVGGVTLERLPAVIATGAAGIAAIGLFLGPARSAGDSRAVPLELIANQIKTRV